MNPDSFRLDSPTPTEAAKQSGEYWAMMQPSFEYGGVDYSAGQLTCDPMSGDVLMIRTWLDEKVVGLTAVRVREVYGERDLYLMATSSEHDINGWIDALDKVLVEIAAEAGCDTITVQTRNGMGRIARRAGYKVHQVIIRKRLRKLQ